MIEDNQASLIGGNDAQAFEKFINAIARLNRAFQQVKFWEFTQPCLFLARALPYISTGRTVEGFLVSATHSHPRSCNHLAYVRILVGLTARNHGYALH